IVLRRHPRAAQIGPRDHHVPAVLSRGPEGHPAAVGRELPLDVVDPLWREEAGHRQGGPLATAAIAAARRAEEEQASRTVPDPDHLPAPPRTLATAAAVRFTISLWAARTFLPSRS